MDGVVAGVAEGGADSIATAVVESLLSAVCGLPTVPAGDESVSTTDDVVGRVLGDLLDLVCPPAEETPVTEHGTYVHIHTYVHMYVRTHRY